MTVTSDQIAAGMRAAVPFNSTIGVEYGDITETSAVLTEVTIRDADGTTTSEMTVSWALRPNRT